MLMTLEQAARKINKAPSTLCELEKREFSENITLSNLRNTAKQLGFTLEYQLKPIVPLEQQLIEQAIKQIKEELGTEYNDHTEEQIERYAAELISEGKPLTW